MRKALLVLLIALVTLGCGLFRAVPVQEILEEVQSAVEEQGEDSSGSAEEEGTPVEQEEQPYCQDTIPVMPGGTVVGEELSQACLFTIEVDADEVTAYYQEQLDSLGWSRIEVKKPLPISTEITAEKGSQNVLISINEIQGICTVTIVLQ